MLVYGLAFGIFGVALFGSLAWIILVDDPFGGEPVASTSLKIAASPQTDSTVTISNGTDSNSRSQNITPSNLPENPAGDIIISTTGVTAEPSDGNNNLLGRDEDLTEKTRFGLIPQVGPDGVRPMDYYARPVSNTSFGLSRVMIIVGGLGLSQTSTQEALKRLPAEVTFAFAPYGNSLDRWVSAARRDGHEVLLQVPQEPFNYPNNDPGPHTLLTQLSAEQNQARLHWLMARISNYTGVINYMGGQFSSHSGAMTTFLEEIADRGLLFVYDGVASYGEVKSLATATGTPFARADIVLDATPNAESIDNALLQLEALARERGIAVATASALPVSIDRISRWAESAAERGLEIIPAAAAVTALENQSP
jgi:hypothetical protein